MDENTEQYIHLLNSASYVRGKFTGQLIAAQKILNMSAKAWSDGDTPKAEVLRDLSNFLKTESLEESKLVETQLSSDVKDAWDALNKVIA